MFLDPKAVSFFNQREISESSPQVHQQRNVSFQEYLRTLEELALLRRVVFARSKQQMVIGEEYITTPFIVLIQGPVSLVVTEAAIFILGTALKFDPSPKKGLFPDDASRYWNKNICGVAARQAVWFFCWAGCKNPGIFVPDFWSLRIADFCVSTETIFWNPKVTVPKVFHCFSDPFQLFCADFLDHKAYIET